MLPLQVFHGAYKDAQRLHNFYGRLLQNITYFPFVCVLWPNSFISDDERRKTQGNKNYFLFLQIGKWIVTGMTQGHTTAEGMTQILLLRLQSFALKHLWHWHWTGHQKAGIPGVVPSVKPQHSEPGQPCLHRKILSINKYFLNTTTPPVLSQTLGSVQTGLFPLVFKSPSTFQTLCLWKLKFTCPKCPVLFLECVWCWEISPGSYTYTLPLSYNTPVLSLIQSIVFWRNAHVFPHFCWANPKPPFTVPPPPIWQSCGVITKGKKNLSRLRCHSVGRILVWHI